MHNMRRALQAVLSAGSLWVIGAQHLHAAEVPAPPREPAGNAAASGDAAANEWRDKLRRPPSSTPGNALFETKSWLPPEPPRRPVVRAPEPPTAPPFPYQFIGRLEADGKPQTVYLTKQDQVYAVAPGEVIEGTYRILDVTAESMEVMYLPLNMKQKIAFSAIVPTPVATRQGSRTPDSPSIVAPTSVSIPPPMNLSPPMATSGRGAPPAAQTAPGDRRSVQRQNPDPAAGDRENTGQQQGGASAGAPAAGTAANPGASAGPASLVPSPVVVSPPTLSAFGSSPPAQGAQAGAPQGAGGASAPAPAGAAPTPNAQPAGRM
jgi:hypothetical protein